MSDVLFVFLPRGLKGWKLFSSKRLMGWAWGRQGRQNHRWYRHVHIFCRIIFGHDKGIYCPCAWNFDYGGSVVFNLLTMSHSVNRYIFGPIVWGLPSSNGFFGLPYPVIDKTYLPWYRKLIIFIGIFVNQVISVSPNSATSVVISIETLDL